MSTQRGLTTLRQDDVRITKRGRFSLVIDLLAQGNGLSEIAQGVPAMGANQLFFYPHDHGPRGGGVPLPRGCVFSWDMGNGDRWDINTTTINTWYKRNRDGTSLEALRASGNPNTSLATDIVAYASPGIDSGVTARSGQPCRWEALALTRCTAGALSLRFYNRTAGAFSGTQAGVVGTQPQWFAFTDLPVRGGRINELDIHAQSTIGASVRILSLVIFETRRNSQPRSQGTREPSVTTPVVTP